MKPNVAFFSLVGARRWDDRPKYVRRLNSISNHVLHEAAQEFAGTSRPGALSAPKVDISASTPRRRQKQDLSAPAGMTDRNMLDVVPRTFARSNIP